MGEEKLAVRYDGEGFPVLIIHGWKLAGITEAHDFEPIFAKRSGYRRIYIDLPGMGDSPIGGVSNLDSILERVSEFVEKNILPSKFLLTGSSCGAYLARALAYKYSSSIDGLLLRVPVVEPDMRKRDMDAFAPVIADEAVLSSLSDADREQLEEVIVQTPAFVDKLRRKYAAAITPAVAAADIATLDMIRIDPDRYKVAAAMHSPESPFLKPTLILTGRQDTTVGYREAWPLIKSYPRASFVALDRAAHDMPVDDDGLFEALVRDWLRRCEELRQWKSLA